MKNAAELDYIHETKLKNGLTILTEEMNNVRSLSVGIWIKSGSRHEADQVAGITHFLEHMLFKGTKNRSSFEIAQSMESVGGYLNAFTSSEYTCYFARCLDTELERAVDVLSDMVTQSTFPEEEIEKEKKVVIEEMKMYRDSPDDFVFEEFSSQVFNHHPLGRPIIGFENTVNAFTQQNLFDYVDERYFPSNIIVTVAGNADHEQVVALVKKYFDTAQSKEDKWKHVSPQNYLPSRKELTKKIEQTHYIMGKQGLSNSHDDKFKLLLVNTVLGSGMSSRLHQNIREKYGYCYSTFSFNQSYRDSGLYGVYIGTDKEYVEHVKELVQTEFKSLRDDLIPEQELEEAKTQLKGKMLLAQESTSNRMMRLAKSQLYFDRYVTLDELVEEIDSVNATEIRDFSAEFFKDEDMTETILMPED